MKRSLAAAAVLGGVLLVGGWLLWAAQGVPRETPAGSPSRTPPRTATRAHTESRSDPRAASRNIFEFADEGGSTDVVLPRLPPASIASAEVMPEAVPPTLPEAPVRLVGVVLRGGQRKAALAIRGELAVIGPGESAEGYTVVSIDEENGVRLKGPEGEITLVPPVEPPGA